MADEAIEIGPLLFARGTDGASGRHRLSALVGCPEGLPDPPECAADGSDGAPVEVDRLGGRVFWRYDFDLPARGGWYAIGGRGYTVRLAGPREDLSLAFVSCNGKEEGDFERPTTARQAMWARLSQRHRLSPLSLLLHGGDQIYADAVLAAHPDLTRWAGLPPDRRADVPASPELERAATDFFLDRWTRTVGHPDTARLMAEVPSLAMWDDHDIFDGYGSHPRPVQESPVGQALFRVARRFYRVFQAGGVPEPDRETWTVGMRQPGFAIVAPDLRSERQPDRVMGPVGWAETDRFVAELPGGEPLFILSTVPALGPRLSLLEGLHRIVPGAQKYEDDLRDQWQSRAHRAEWRRLLSLAAKQADAGAAVTFLSGEIHLAARGEMRTPGGAIVHQLIASGISHPPPPPAFARALGALAALGGAPLKGHPIALKALPGQRRRYVAERNYLILERKSGRWSAQWELEESGPTERLALTPRTPSLDLDRHALGLTAR